MSSELTRWMPDTSLMDIQDVGMTRRARNPVSSIRAMGDAYNISSAISAQSALAETWLLNRRSGETFMTASMRASVGGFFSCRTFNGSITIRTG